MDEYREQISIIDQQLITLLEERVDISKKIGDYKCKHKLSIFEPDIETHIIKKFQASSSLSNSHIRTFFKGVFEISCHVQQLDRLESRS